MLPAPLFDDVFDAHFSWVWSTIQHLGVSERDAPDVAQEVFVVVHSLLGEYDPSRPLRPWLFGIAYRIAARWRALARHRRELPIDEPIDLADGQQPADEALEAREARDLVWRAIDTVDLRWRAVLIMNLLDEQPMPEVAQRLGIPINTAYSRLRLARADLAQAVRTSRAHPAGSSLRRRCSP